MSAAALRPAWPAAPHPERSGARGGPIQARGFQLVGGRLLPAASGPGAQFMYQDAAGTRLTLYLGAPDARYAGTAFRYAREDGLGVFYWVEGPFAYALSGPQPRAELLSSAEAACRQLRP